jgi:ubiquinol-cytochrome c reductase cytochrome b subunit
VRPLDWIDRRVDLASLRRTLLDREVPGGLTWWHTLGSATFAVFVVQVVTGTVLAMYYSASPDHAYASVRYLQDHVLSGATIRGIHHWGSSAMVILVVAHMTRVFTSGAYKYPREINWLLGVGLFLLVLTFAFTGYLLPWDQKAYWATQVGTNMVGTTPVFGEVMVKLLRGGTELGAATLSRFFALHVLLLPALFGGAVLLHLALVIRQGIAARSEALESGAPARTSDAAYPAFYETAYKASKGAHVRFWPDITAKDMVVATVVILAMVILGTCSGAPLEDPADPTDSAYLPRPEWYFLPLFQLLKLAPGSLESLVAVGVPGALVVTLVFLPFVDRRSTRSFSKRPAARLVLLSAMGATAMLLGAGLADAPENKAVNELGQPLNSVERAGRAMFDAQGCGSCHLIAGKGGTRKEDAPELTDVALRHSGAWLHSFMENPLRFHPDSKMPSFGPPTLSHQEIEEITRYLLTLRGLDPTRKPEYADTFPEPPTPKATVK